MIKKKTKKKTGCRLDIAAADWNCRFTQSINLFIFQHYFKVKKKNLSEKKCLLQHLSWLLSCNINYKSPQNACFPCILCLFSNWAEAQMSRKIDVFGQWEEPEHLQGAQTNTREQMYKIHTKTPDTLKSTRFLQGGRCDIFLTPFIH